MSVIDRKSFKEFYGDNVIFIFPSNILGGHELMAIEIIKDFVNLGLGVSVYIEPNNENLVKIFESINIQLEIYKLPVSKRRLESIFAFFDFIYIKKIRLFFNNITKNKIYDSIIIVQGDIEIGSSYLVAAKRENIDLISYLPFTHTKAKMKKQMSFLRDKFDSVLYTYVDSYITIYKDALEDLYKLNPKSKNYIIKNKVRDLSEFSLLKSNKLNSDKLKIYIIGRVEFLQKGHDQFLSALEKLSNDKINKIELHVIGDGPDFQKIKKMLEDFNNLDYKLHGWMKEPWSTAFDADLLIIPSNFEGVPLVMLEAIELGVPILARKLDGMKDYLLSDNLYTNNMELKEKLEIFIDKFTECK